MNNVDQPAGTQARWLSISIGCLIPILLWLTARAMMSDDWTVEIRELLSAWWGRALLFEICGMVVLLGLGLFAAESNRWRAAAWLVAILLVGAVSPIAYFLLQLNRTQNLRRTFQPLGVANWQKACRGLGKSISVLLAVGVAIALALGLAANLEASSSVQLAAVFSNACATALLVHFCAANLLICLWIAQHEQGRWRRTAWLVAVILLGLMASFTYLIVFGRRNISSENRT